MIAALALALTIVSCLAAYDSSYLLPFSREVDGSNESVSASQCGLVQQVLNFAARLFAANSRQEAS